MFLRLWMMFLHGPRHLYPFFAILLFLVVCFIFILLA